ncbi:MAG: hypothetical protein JXR78_02100 [Victivallales bacterium]|nr:hypothetical protein [Victivallales bacterium]
MKAGEKIICPLCKQETFVKEGAILDGWTVTAKILKCALCDGKLADFPEPATEPATDKNKNTGLSAFANFLGEDAPVSVKHNISQDVRRFCKDCAHFIEHPFHTRCGLWDKTTDPMDDCEKFTPRKS